MNVSLIPNSGIMSDDRLDGLRQQAVMAHHDTPLPMAVVIYLRALEADYLDRIHAEKKRAASEIGWRLEE